MIAISKPTNYILPVLNIPVTEATKTPTFPISYRNFPCDGLARQILIFESAPSIANPSQGKGMVLVELSDGRIYFFRTSMAVIKGDIGANSIFEKLHSLPAWIIDLKAAAAIIGYTIGAVFEFIEKDPSIVENWNIQEWKQYAASRVAVSKPAPSIQQINMAIIQEAGCLNSALSEKLAEFMDTLASHGYPLQSQFESRKYCVIHNYFMAGNEQQRRYRRQVSQTFPLIMEHLFACPNDEHALPIIEAIDRGAPLVDYLSDIFGCPKKCIRRMIGIRLEDIGNQWAGRIKELLAILGSLDLNRLPKKKDQWIVFGETVELLSAITKIPITSISNRMLLGEISKQNWQHRIDAQTGIRERALAIEGLFVNFRDAIYATAWVNNKPCTNIAIFVQQIAVSAIYSLRLSRLERLARRWVAEERRLDAKMIVFPENGFPVLLDEPLNIGSMKVIQIKAPDELLIEGECMSNCVGGYSSSCASGSAYIFSVRDNIGVSRVTVEYRLKESVVGMPTLELIQQKGIKNSTPCSQYQDALNGLDCYINLPVVRKKLLAFAAYNKAWKKRGSSDNAIKYLRALEFMQFLKDENVSQFDFEKLVADVIKKESVEGAV